VTTGLPKTDELILTVVVVEQMLLAMPPSYFVAKTSLFLHNGVYLRIAWITWLSWS